MKNRINKKTIKNIIVISLAVLFLMFSLMTYIGATTTPQVALLPDSIDQIPQAWITSTPALHNGLASKPIHIQSHTSFVSNGALACVNTAAANITVLGFGKLIFHESTYHSITTYPLKNNLSQITAINGPVGGYVAETHGYLVNGKLTEGDININTRYAFVATNPSSSQYHLPTVLMHEFGHVIGINHNTTDTKSIMYPTIPTGSVSRSFVTFDINCLKILYP